MRYSKHGCWMSKGQVLRTLYFVGPENRSCVKIGVTGNLEQRLRDLRRASPGIVVFASCPGRGDEEQAMHRAFKEHRIYGEWFHFRDDVARTVAHVRRLHAIPKRFVVVPRDWLIVTVSPRAYGCRKTERPPEGYRKMSEAKLRFHAAQLPAKRAGLIELQRLFSGASA